MKDPRAIIPMSLAKRLTQVVTYGLTGGFFSPQLPLQPQHQETAGRRLDFIAGYNISTKPRRDSGVSFELLRAFSENYDILRLMIEKRKDQIANFDWSIVPTDEAVAKIKGDAAKTPKAKMGKASSGKAPNVDGNSGNAADAALDMLQERAAAAQRFLKFPDGVQPWNTWIRVLTEDMLVLDGILIYPTYKGSQCAKLEFMDPTTIIILIDESGRRPEPPFPAYQQVLHGIPASDYLKDELYYYISNPASNRIYGRSKVEQILVTIQIGLRRELSQLQFFTDGNVPAAIAGVPDNWTPTQIENFQQAFDAMLQGDTGARRKMWFVPGEPVKNIKEMRSEEATLKAEFDEWIIRIICFCFGVSPTPFIKQMNRATAFTAQEEARDEGLGPQLTFLKSVMDSILVNCLKLEGVEFKWSMESENDPTTQATIDDQMLRNGSRSLDELRQRDGLDPLGCGAMIYLPTGPIMVKDLVAGKVGPAAQAAQAAQIAQNGGQNGPPNGGSGPAPGGKGGAPGNGSPKGGKPDQDGSGSTPKPDTTVASNPDGNKPDVNDKGASSAKAKAKGINSTNKPLAVKKGGSVGSANPFRPGKLFSYAASTFRDPKRAAASGRLIKASQQSRDGRL